MVQLKFKTLSFHEIGETVQVTLLKLFSTGIPVEELKKIGAFKLKDEHTLVLEDKNKRTESKLTKNKSTKSKFTKNKLTENESTESRNIENRFYFLLSKYFFSLKNNLTKNPATYIHRHSGIPLLGNVAFGIVYRNSSVIEIKPITSCNLNCIYCSIAEGLTSKKHDFVVEKDYLVDELIKLITFVAAPVEIHVGVQGEPFLYADLEELISDLQALDQVQTISIDTNGTLLTTSFIDRLAEKDVHKKLQLNFSLDSLNEQKAKQMAGTENYKIKHIQEMIAYASGKVKVIVAPVYVPGYNDEDLEEIIQFIKSLKPQPLLGIQNFLQYKTGRNPAKEITWKKFYFLMGNLEKKHQIKLIFKKEDFNIRPAKELSKPFTEGEVITATLKCPDRFPNSAIAVAKERTISVPNCRFEAEKKVKVKIVKDKHNIFVGKLV